MAETQAFTLPDVGEGLTEAEIVRWRVAVGDTIAVNDVIVEIETAKSLVELPSPYAGTVSDLLVAEGENIEVGTAIILIDGHESSADNDAGAGLTSAQPPRSSQHGETPQPLVGSGPKADPIQPRRRKPIAAHKNLTLPQQQQAFPTVHQETPPGKPPRVLAKPPVRKKAKNMGFSLEDVPPSGRCGQVTHADLMRYADMKQNNAGVSVAHITSSSSGSADLAGHNFWAADGKEYVERIPVKGVRKATAQAMVNSAFTAPHVSVFVDVDASRTMEFVKRLKTSSDFEHIKISPLLILAKAVIWAAARNPMVNATWAEDEILVHHYMNLGIAAATPRGLLVPNIKNAHELSLKELAIALNDLATVARAGKTQPDEMRRGTLTVTNIGALGIDTGTPIINPGEVAIVAFGTIKQKPWVLDGEVITRWVTTLGGSFDHRVVDGDLSARFMADVAAVLEEPALLLE